MTSAEWAAWNSTETCSADADKRIPEIIADYAEVEARLNSYLGRLDISEHDGMAWKDRAENAEREVDTLKADRDEWKAMADKGATTLVEYAAEKEKAEDEVDALRLQVDRVRNITHPVEGPCRLCGFIFDTHNEDCPYSDIDAALAGEA